MPETLLRAWSAEPPPSPPLAATDVDAAPVARRHLSPIHGEGVSAEPARDLEAHLAAARPRLLRIARLQGVPADAVDDVVQEALLEAWRAVEALRHPERVDAWLDGICRNVCRRHARTRGTLAAREEPLLPEECEVADPFDPEEQVSQQDLSVLLDRALGHLHPVARKALILRYLLELPTSEVAAKLGLSMDALGVRLHRGRRELRQILRNTLRAEAEAYGLLLPGDASEQSTQETRIWCPLCGAHRLFVESDHEYGAVRFSCPACAPSSIAGTLLKCEYAPNVVAGVSSPKAMLSRMLTYLDQRYRDGLTAGRVVCISCGRDAVVVPSIPDGVPDEVLGLHGLHIVCPHCQLIDINDVGRLSLDLAATQRFWREHPRMRALPVREVETAGRPVLVTTFVSLRESARINVLHDRETLQLIAIHGGA